MLSSQLVILFEPGWSHVNDIFTGPHERHPNMTDERSVGDGWPGQVIQQAVLYDNVELLQCLLEGEELANINATDTCGRTAIYTAVSNNSLQCLSLLLEHGGMICLKYSSLMYVTVSHFHAQM